MLSSQDDVVRQLPNERGDREQREREATTGDTVTQAVPVVAGLEQGSDGEQSISMVVTGEGDAPRSGTGSRRPAFQRPSPAPNGQRWQ